MCWSGFEPETTDHYLLSCKVNSDLRLDSLNCVFAMNQTLKKSSDEQLANVLLYGFENFTFITNAKYLSHTIKFFKAIECFFRLLSYIQKLTVINFAIIIIILFLFCFAF